MRIDSKALFDRELNRNPADIAGTSASPEPLMSHPACAIPVVRQPDFDLSQVPRDWYLSDPVRTCLFNGLHLIIPAVERFLVRSAFAVQLPASERALRQRLGGFARQEAVHNAVHESCLQMLKRQGFELDSWLDWYDRTAYGRLESMTPPLFRLSVTAALEHLIAAAGEWFLCPNNPNHRDSDPTMVALFHWHACEEIEHQSVVFDLLEAAGGNLLLRWAGMVTAFTLTVVFWLSATRHLIRQDSRISARRILRSFRERSETVLPSMVRAGLAYMRPGFHPDRYRSTTTASSWLARQGLPPLAGASV